MRTVFPFHPNKTAVIRHVRHEVRIIEHGFHFGTHIVNNSVKKGDGRIQTFANNVHVFFPIEMIIYM